MGLCAARWLQQVPESGAVSDSAGKQHVSAWDLRACDEGLDGAVLAGLGGLVCGVAADDLWGGRVDELEDAVKGLSAVGEEGDVRVRDALCAYVWRTLLRDWREHSATLDLQRGNRRLSHHHGVDFLHPADGKCWPRRDLGADTACAGARDTGFRRCTSGRFQNKSKNNRWPGKVRYLPRPQTRNVR